MKLDEFNDALQRFSAAGSIDEITELCRFHCRQLGFDNFVYALRIPTHFSASRLILIDGYPSSWVNHYFTQAYFKVDPVMDYCARHIVPIQWHNMVIEPTSMSAKMMNEAAEFGLKVGITMPIHGSNGELGILSFTLNRTVTAGYEVTQYALPYIQLLAAYLHEAVRRVSGLNEDAGKLQLSSREQECLRWVADGKSSWEIAKILSLSERTVNFHLNNAVLKLDSSSRQHAVVKAVLQKLIRPHPF